jgi:hypothetical protein
VKLAITGSPVFMRDRAVEFKVAVKDTVAVPPFSEVFTYVLLKRT